MTVVGARSINIIKQLQYIFFMTVVNIMINNIVLFGQLMAYSDYELDEV